MKTVFRALVCMLSMGVVFSVAGQPYKAVDMRVSSHTALVHGIFNGKNGAVGVYGNVRTPGQSDDKSAFAIVDSAGSIRFTHQYENSPFSRALAGGFNGKYIWAGGFIPTGNTMMKAGFYAYNDSLSSLEGINYISSSDEKWIAGLAVLADSSMVMCGMNGDGAGLVKVNKYLNTVWSWPTPAGVKARFRAITATVDKGFVVAGSVDRSDSEKGLDVVIVKFDSAGTLKWFRYYGGAQDDEALDIAACPDSGFAIVGATRSFGSGGEDAFICKVDSVGNFVWKQTSGGTNDDVATGLHVTKNGTGFVVCGNSKSQPADSTAFLWGVTGAGTTLWNMKLPGFICREGKNVIATDDQWTSCVAVNRVLNNDTIATLAYVKHPVVVKVAAGMTQSLFLKTDGSLWGCGSNESGELGDGTMLQESNGCRVQFTAQMPQNSTRRFVSQRRIQIFRARQTLSWLFRKRLRQLGIL